MAGPHSSQYFSTSSVSFVSLSYEQHGIVKRRLRPLRLTETQAVEMESDGATVTCHPSWFAGGNGQSGQVFSLVPSVSSSRR